MNPPDMQSILGFTEAEWLAYENPARLVKRLRGRGNVRQYQLLACAYSLDVPHANLNPLGRKVVTVLRAAAFAGPAKGLSRTDARELLTSQFPACRQYEQLLEPWGALTPMARAAIDPGANIADEVVSSTLRYGMGGPAVNRVGVAVEAQVRYDAYREVREQLNRLLRRPPACGPREAVLRMLPESDRSELRHVRWDAGRIPGRILNRAQALASKERIEAARRVMTELVREVLGNPFRKPVIDPNWLLWNHCTVRHIAEQVAAGKNFADMPILADALEDAGCADEELLRHCREERTHVPGCWALDAILGRG